MAGDIKIEEAVLDSGAQAGSVSHHYGPTVVIGHVSSDEKREQSPSLAEAMAKTDDDIGRAGLAAFELRESPEFKAAKANRENDGLSWDGDPESGLLPPHPPEEMMSKLMERAPGALGAPAASTSQRLKGKVAVGVVVVSGPGSLAFSAAEITNVHAQVQNGLSWLGSHTGSTEPVQFYYDLQTVTLTLPDDPTGSDKEGYWRNPTMAQLGYANPQAYVDHLISTMGTDWGYCAFFVKYTQTWFAYAYLGGAYLCMEYSNDGWGPSNIDRVFTHETGHIFYAPDEYGSSGCNCTSTHGMYQVVNGNCESCAAGGGVDCIMRSNSWSMCNYTLWHLGCPDLDVSISSVAFSGVFLRMDGTGVTAPVGPGGGTVNCQFGVGPWEKYKLVLQKNGAGANDGTFAIESVQWPNVFLRMDGGGVTKFVGPGGGTVNCQFGVGPWEKFWLVPQADGSVAIGSVQWPDVFLRMDGNGVTAPVGAGGGTVNCQFGAHSWERYRLRSN